MYSARLKFPAMLLSTVFKVKTMTLTVTYKNYMKNRGYSPFRGNAP